MLLWLLWRGAPEKSKQHPAPRVDVTTAGRAVVSVAKLPRRFEDIQNSTRRLWDIENSTRLRGDCYYGSPRGGACYYGFCGVPKNFEIVPAEPGNMRNSTRACV